MVIDADSMSVGQSESLLVVTDKFLRLVIHILQASGISRQGEAAKRFSLQMC